MRCASEEQAPMVHPSTLLHCSGQCNCFLLVVYKCVLALSAGKNPSGILPMPSMNCDNIHCLNLWTSRMHWGLMDGGIIKQLSLSPPANLLPASHHHANRVPVISQRTQGRRGQPETPRALAAWKWHYIQWEVMGKVLTKTWHFYVMNSSKQEAVLYVCRQMYTHTGTAAKHSVYTNTVLMDDPDITGICFTRVSET